MTDIELRIDRWFMRYRNALHTEASWSEQADRWTERATCVTKGVSDMPRAASPSGRTDDAYTARIDCADKATEAAKSARAVMDQVTRAISWQTDPVCKDFMLYRYIDGLTMSQISVKMGQSERQIYNLRRRSFERYGIQATDHGGDSLFPAEFFENKVSKRVSCAVYFRV